MSIMTRSRQSRSYKQLLSARGLQSQARHIVRTCARDGHFTFIKQQPLFVACRHDCNSHPQNLTFSHTDNEPSFHSFVSPSVTRVVIMPVGFAACLSGRMLLGIWSDWFFTHRPLQIIILPSKYRIKIFPGRFQITGVRRVYCLYDAVVL
jgi:hypothetical protein